MCEGGLHWTISSAAGFVMTGRFKPVCAIVYGLPDCAARRAFLRLMDRAFRETNHCRRVALTYRVGRLLRG